MEEAFSEKIRNRALMLAASQFLSIYPDDPDALRAALTAQDSDKITVWDPFAGQSLSDVASCIHDLASDVVNLTRHFMREYEQDTQARGRGIKYRGRLITVKFPSGMYEICVTPRGESGRFLVFDDLGEAMKRLDKDIEENESENESEDEE